MTDVGIRTDAVLLRSVDYREADRIVTLLTPDLGRVSAVARGARSSRKRFAGALEPFSVVEVMLQAGRQGLYRLGEARVTCAFGGLLSALRRMEETGRCLEVVRNFAPEHTPEPGLFDESRCMLAAMDARPIERLGLVRLCFVMRLLELVGLGPELRRCGGCGKRPGLGQPASFDALRGHLVCRACGGAAHVLGATERQVWIAGAAGGVTAEPGLEVAAPTIALFENILSTVVSAHAP